MSLEYQILIAVLLDLIFGDPRWFPHPVKFIGRFDSLAPLALGTYTGHFFFGKIREETYRRVILILLLCLGVFTIWNAA